MEEPMTDSRIMNAVARAIAWALPRRVVYWCAVRLMSNGTTGAFSGQVVPDLTAVDALRRW